jgi:hypothetical protein
MTVGAPRPDLFWTEHSRAPQSGRAAGVVRMIVIAAIWALFTIAMRGLLSTANGQNLTRITSA